MNDLERRFSHHPPQNQAVALTHEIWRTNCMALARIMEQLPETRERSTAITKIEEAMMWGNAAIARNGHALPLAVREVARRAEEAAKPADPAPAAPAAAPATPAPADPAPPAGAANGAPKPPAEPPPRRLGPRASRAKA